MITIQIADWQIWDREASALEHGRPVPGLLLLVRSHQTSPGCPLQTRLDEVPVRDPLPPPLSELCCIALRPNHGARRVTSRPRRLE